MQLTVEVVRLWEVPARKALDLDSLALCPWTVLMDSSDDEQREAAARIVASGDRELGLRMAVLAGLRYGNKKEILERFDEMITTQQLIEESTFLRDILQEGKVAGKAEGKAEGEQAADRRTLQRQLTKRFGPIPTSVENEIATAGTARLEIWLDRVVVARSIEEVFAS